MDTIKRMDRAVGAQQVQSKWDESEEKYEDKRSRDQEINESLWLSFQKYYTLEKLKSRMSAIRSGEKTNAIKTAQHKPASSKTKETAGNIKSTHSISRGTNITVPSKCQPNPSSNNVSKSNGPLVFPSVLPQYIVPTGAPSSAPVLVFVPALISSSL
ncbi:hypothetical protein BY996DRAFT_6504324 [Phakopsora pachyrhizi]|nr:hypothetical protein BY996DRAFT_6504324 [Phakopsora pachyrhizi]